MKISDLRILLSLVPDDAEVVIVDRDGDTFRPEVDFDNATRSFGLRALPTEIAFVRGEWRRREE